MMRPRNDEPRMVKRQVIMTFTFPAEMPVEDQDTILEGLTVLPYERAFEPPSRPEEPDDQPHDQRRVVGCNMNKWGSGKFKGNAVGVGVLFPGWMPSEIKAQAELKIQQAAAEIVNGYLARRLVGTEG